MNAYKLTISGVFAIIMAEDDDALMEKTFGHLNKAREIQNQVSGEHELIDRGTLVRLNDDSVVANIEVYTDEVRFVPPEGKVQ